MELLHYELAHDPGIQSHLLPLQQTVQENGRSAEIHIYRSLDSPGFWRWCNEPLSVGSGKKFKKCCGSAAELH